MARGGLSGLLTAAGPILPTEFELPAAFRGIDSAT